MQQSPRATGDNRAKRYGITRLIEIVKKLTGTNRLWWMHVNMRDPLHHWTNVEVAYRSLLQLTTDFSRWTKAASMHFLHTLQLNIPLSEGASPSSISCRHPEHYRPSDIAAFVEMQSATEQVMNGMRRSLWSGQYFPVLLRSV